jgi:hypothetical protein
MNAIPAHLTQTPHVCSGTGNRAVRHYLEKIRKGKHLPRQQQLGIIFF